MSLTTWGTEALRCTVVSGSSLRNGLMSGAKRILPVWSPTRSRPSISATVESFVWPKPWLVGSLKRMEDEREAILLVA